MLSSVPSDTVAIALALVGASLAAMAFVPMRPVWGIHAWVALLPFQFTFLRDRLNFNFAPADIIAVGLLAALGLDLIRHTRRRAGGRAATLGLSFVVPLTVSLVIGLVLGTFVSYAVVNKWCGYSFLALTAFAIARLLQDDFHAVIDVTRTFLIAALAAAIVSVAAYWLGYDKLWVWSAVQSDRLAGTLLEAPPFGALLVVAFLIQTVAVISGTRILPVPLGWLNWIVLLHAICLTFARSAWVGLTCGAIVIALTSIARRSVSLSRLAVIALACIVTAGATFAATFERRSTHSGAGAAQTHSRRSAGFGTFIQDMFVRERTANIRYVQITEGLRLWTQAPVAGIGLGRFLLQSPRWFGDPYQIHNTFVWLLVETGIIGLLWFAALIAVVLDEYRIGARAGSERQWWALAFCAAFVSLLGFMLGNEGLYQRQFWWLVGIAAAVSAAGTTRSAAVPAPRRESTSGRPPVLPLAIQVVTRLNVGGITHQVIVLAQELRQAGYASAIAAGQPAASEGNRADSARQAGLEVHDIRFLSNRINPLRDVRASIELFRLFRRRRPAVVHLYMLKARILGAIAARLAGVPVVVETLHGNLLQGYYNRAGTALVALGERVLGWLVVDRVIAPTRSQRDELVEFRVAPSERIVAQLPGMDVTGFAELTDKRDDLRRQLGISPEVVLIGIIGRLVPIKGLDVFLDAAARVRKDRPDAVFFAIAGDGPLRPELGEHASRLGLAERCIFLGQVTAIASFYAACDVIAMSSRNEGAPIALLEAMAAGKAIVATRVGGIPDMVEDEISAVLVPKEDPDALARALVQLVSDPAVRDRLGRAARQRTAEFTVARFADVTARMYDQLASPGAAAG
jgi:glycosyltransferase involved in cell wall biosynthesis